MKLNIAHFPIIRKISPQYLPVGLPLFAHCLLSVEPMIFGGLRPLLAASIIVVVVVLIKNWLGLEVNFWPSLRRQSRARIACHVSQFRQSLAARPPI